MSEVIAPVSPIPPKRPSLYGLGLILTLLLLMAGAGAGIWVHNQIMGPGPLEAPATVLIGKGSSMREMARTLEREKVVGHWLTWWLLARSYALPSQLKAGEYAFPEHVSTWQALVIMRSGQVVVRKITVAEGLTSAEIVTLLKAEDKLTGTIDTLPPEGSLLPETYQYLRGDTRAEIIERMQQAQTQVMNELWPDRASGLPYETPLEAVTLASIVEKETGIESERPRIAGVFANRLREGIKLQSDPTTIYALTEGRGSMQAVLGRPLYRSDWKLANPYNTYHIVGLPPGPIANPGRESIYAALHPEPHEYLFFVADGKGGHAFTRSLKQHNENIEEWRKVKAGKKDAKVPEKAALPEDAVDDAVPEKK